MAVVAGSLRGAAGDVLLVGLKDIPADAQVRGARWSPRGYWFFYVPATGGLAEFRRSLSVPPQPTGRLAVFIEHTKGAGPLEVSLTNARALVPVTIYGSCVSRDCFVRPEAPVLRRYHARSSVASAMSRLGSGLEHADLSANPSAFQRRMVQEDLARALPGHLSEIGDGPLLIDFIDERFDLAWGDRFGPVTMSDELVLSRLDLSDRDVRPSTDGAYYAAFEEGWRRLTTLVPPDRILLNKVFWATHDSHGNALPNPRTIEANNAKLTRLYYIVERVSPGVHRIEHDPSLLVADHDHKWGISPFHYVPEFELALIDQLNAFLAGRGQA